MFHLILQITRSPLIYTYLTKYHELFIFLTYYIFILCSLPVLFYDQFFKNGNLKYLNILKRKKEKKYKKKNSNEMVLSY